MFSNFSERILTTFDRLTSKGVLTDKQAKSQNIGGELICSIF